MFVKTSFEVDTALWEDFNTALNDESSTATFVRTSEAHDNGRYTVNPPSNARTVQD